MARAKKERTPDEVDARKSVKIEKRVAKKAALKLVLAFVSDTVDVDSKEAPELLAAVTLLTTGNRGATISTSKAAVIAMITDKVNVTEDEIWSEFKLGRAEMRKITVNLIKRAKAPEDRLWVAFDPQEGTYTLVADGPEVPKGWTGYRPVDVEDLDI